MLTSSVWGQNCIQLNFSLCLIILQINSSWPTLSTAARWCNHEVCSVVLLHHFKQPCVCVCVSEFKALKSYSRNRYSRSVSMTNSYPGNSSVEDWAQPIRDESEDEFSGMGGAPTDEALINSLKVTHRWVVCWLCAWTEMTPELNLVL